MSSIFYWYLLFIFIFFIYWLNNGQVFLLLIVATLYGNDCFFFILQRYLVEYSFRITGCNVTQLLSNGLTQRFINYLSAVVDQDPPTGMEIEFFLFLISQFVEPRFVLNDGSQLFYLSVFFVPRDWLDSFFSPIGSFIIFDYLAHFLLIIMFLDRVFVCGWWGGGYWFCIEIVARQLGSLVCPICMRIV